MIKATISLALRSNHFVASINERSREKLSSIGNSSRKSNEHRNQSEKQTDIPEFISNPRKIPMKRISRSDLEFDISRRTWRSVEILQIHASILNKAERETKKKRNVA